MMGSNLGEIKKIILVVIVLFILLLSALAIKAQRQLSFQQIKETPKENPVVLSPVPTVFETPGVYSINLVKSKVKTGETLTAEINFFAEGKFLDGSDVILKFDPAMLSVSENITKGDFFVIYPISKVDSAKGEIRVSGFEAKDKKAMTDPQTLFTAEFTALKPGKTNISFEFQKGKTNGTTLVESKTSRNILGLASSAVVEIE